MHARAWVCKHYVTSPIMPAGELVVNTFNKIVSRVVSLCAPRSQQQTLIPLKACPKSIKVVCHELHVNMT